MTDSRGTPVHLQVRGEPSERMGWVRDRADLVSLLRQYAGYIERGGDNRSQSPAAPTGGDVPPPPEPEREEDR